VTNAAAKYVYDAEGRRVAKENSGTGAVTASYALSLGGDQLDEMNTSGVWQHSNIFAMGKIHATYGVEQSTQTTRFHLNDWLGTRRVDLSPSGSSTLSCFNYPFGDAYTSGLSCTGTDTDITEQHFTGQTRDSETGEDDFGARYYASMMGRFLTADEVRNDAHPGNPQSWNLYAYVHNSPLSFVDPNGEYSEAAMQEEKMMNENMAGMDQEMRGYVNLVNDLFTANAMASFAKKEAQQQQKSCGFFCRLFHTDHVPYRLVIMPGETENGISNSKFHYELQNREGQKLTGKYGLKEHIWDDPGAQHHHVGGHNSEGVFAPQNSQGEWVDTVGYTSLQGGLYGGSYDVYQTFSVSYKGTSTDLSTEFEHTTSVVGINVFANVIDIKP
jgi:RHS repeat-associated protein